MLEQAVSKGHDSPSRRWSKILRVFQIVLLVIFVICEGFGLSLSRIYWETDRDLFWRWLMQLAVTGLPLALLIVGLQYPVCKLKVQYDYTLQDQRCSVYRFWGNRRKIYLFFDLDSIDRSIEADAIEAGSEEEQYFRRAVNVTCNDDAEHLILVHVEDCIFKGRHQSAWLLLELNRTFYDAFSAHLRRNRR